MGKHYINIKKRAEEEVLGYLPVKGKLFEFEGNQMIVHRPFEGGLNKEGLFSGSGQYFKINKDDGFCVSCVKTGLKAWQGYYDENRQETIDGFIGHMKATFPNKRHKNLKECIKEGIKLYGSTPEFDKSKEHLILKDRLLK
jgi:hypothetical protein